MNQEHSHREGKSADMRKLFRQLDEWAHPSQESTKCWNMNKADWKGLTVAVRGTPIAAAGQSAQPTRKVKVGELWSGEADDPARRRLYEWWRKATDYYIW